MVVVEVTVVVVVVPVVVVGVTFVVVLVVVVVGTVVVVVVVVSVVPVVVGSLGSIPLALHGILTKQLLIPGDVAKRLERKMSVAAISGSHWIWGKYNAKTHM